MSYVDDLIEHKTNFQVRRSAGSASFTPASGRDEDIEAFQSVVRDLRRNEGAGYAIQLDHTMSDRSGAFVDLVVLTLGEV